MVNDFETHSKKIQEKDVLRTKTNIFVTSITIIDRVYLCMFMIIIGNIISCYSATNLPSQASVSEERL